MFKDAVLRLSGIKPSITTSEITQIENIALEVIRPIPSSKRNINLEGYRFLNYLNPSNGVYSLKIIQYDDNIRLDSSVKTLSSSIDKFTKVTTYFHPSIPQSVSAGSRIRLNIVMDTSGNTSLRLGTIYNSDRWLWVNKVDVLIDGTNLAFTYGDFNRDNSTNIWEWREESPSSKQLYALQKIASAKSVTLRFYGEEFYSDRKLKQMDIQAVSDVLHIFDQIKKVQLSTVVSEMSSDFVPKKIIRSVGSKPMRCYDPSRNLVYSHSPYGISCSSKDYAISEKDFMIFKKLNSE